MRNSAALTLVPNAAPDRVGLRRRGRSPRAGGVRRQCGVGRLLRVLSFVARARPLAGDRAGRRSRLRGSRGGWALGHAARARAHMASRDRNSPLPPDPATARSGMHGGDSRSSEDRRSGPRGRKEPRRSDRDLSSRALVAGPFEFLSPMPSSRALARFRGRDRFGAARRGRGGGGAGRPPAEVERASTGPAVGGSRTRRSAGGGSLVAEFGETHLRLPPRDSPLR